MTTAVALALALAAQSAPVQDPAAPPAPSVDAPDPSAPAVLTVTRQLVDSGSYFSADSRYLPDPLHPDVGPFEATREQISAAHELNLSLDVWRVCGWTGHEQPAAAFAAWSRTHLVGDHAAPGRRDIAWRRFGDISAAKTMQFREARDSAAWCRTMRPDMVRMRADMDHQMEVLVGRIR